MPENNQKTEWIRQQWQAWKTCYRSERPEAVTCGGCQTEYQPNEHAATMRFEGITLVACSNCE